MTGPATTNRAEHLRVWLDYATEHGVRALRPPDGVHEDFALVNACLAVESYALSCQWRALERLLPLIPTHGGTYTETVHLPHSDAVRAMQALHRLGWLRTAPRPGDDDDDA